MQAYVCGLVVLLVTSATSFATPLDGLDWALVGNPGNAPEPNTGRGAVSDPFVIGKREITNAQFVVFLNAVAKTDPNGLYDQQMAAHRLGGINRSGERGEFEYSIKLPVPVPGLDDVLYEYERKPVNFVSANTAKRYINWLFNGTGNADTESGVYTFADGVAGERSPDALVWLPNIDEWAKAAFHDKSAGTSETYFQYATGTNEVPDNNPPELDSGNSVNYKHATGSTLFSLTDVGAYGATSSSYGVFDMNGNVNELNEGPPSGLAGKWGGTSNDPNPWNLNIEDLFTISTDQAGATLGFRIAGSVDLLSLPRGDFNFDGVVDAADYTAWRDGYSEGRYTIDDYQTWRGNYGNRAGSASMPTPEPSTLFLASIGSIGSLRRRRW